MAPCQKYIHVQAPTATMNKRPAFKVPLQTELRFHLRRYEQPHSIGGPAERQKTDERHAVAHSSSGDDDDPAPSGRTVAAMASGRTLLQPCPRPRRRSRGEDKYKEPEARSADGGGDPVGDGDFSSRLRLGTDDRGRQPTGRSPLRSSRTSGAPTSARRRRTSAKAGPPQNTKPPWQRATSWAVLPCARRDNRPCGKRGRRKPSQRAQRAEADDARRRPAPRCRSPPLSQGQ
jgi:hypothetical protein